MKLETNPKVLQRQQVILAFLGYYEGKLDGIWGKDSINAKKDFEVSGKFAPGLPNRGLPFVNTDSMPKGVFSDPFNKGLLSAKGLSEDDIAKMIQEKGEHTGNAITKNIEAPIIDKPKVEDKTKVDVSGSSITDDVYPAPVKEEIKKESVDSGSEEKVNPTQNEQVHPQAKKKSNPNQQRHRQHS